MAIPETDQLRIERWCRGRVPEQLRDQVRIEADAAARHVTIVETRPPWRGEGEWTRSPVARLRYTQKTGQWSLYWCDRNEKFHEYPGKRPTKDVQRILDHIDRDEDALLWG